MPQTDPNFRPPSDGVVFTPPGDAGPFTPPVDAEEAEEQGFLSSLGSAMHTFAVDQVPQFLATQAQRQLSEFSQSPRVQSLYPDESRSEMEQRVKAALVGSEREIQTQKDQSAEKLKGVVQDIREIKSATGLASFIGQAIGQGLVQIPLSVVSGGTSSWLQESSAIYDEQLDKRAEELGISREEVLTRGLDDPSGGQAFAVLAASLDAVSAGKVLKMFKSAALKNITMEMVTEGLQDVAEQVGSNVGADQNPLNVDLGRSASASVAGGFGAGPFAAVSAIKAPKSIKEVQPPTEPLVSTGDPALDQTIDQLADQSAQVVARVNEKLDQTLQDIDAQSVVEEAIETAQKAETESKQPIAPEVTPEVTPTPESAPVEQAVPETPQGLSLTETIIDSVDPDTKQDIKKAANSFVFNDPAGTAEGNIVDDSAVILNIFAATQEDGSPVKGGGLYKKTVGSLREQGVNTLVVGAQSPGSTGALTALTKTGELSIDPTGTDPKLKGVDGNPVHTKFKINPEPIPERTIRSKIPTGKRTENITLKGTDPQSGKVFDINMTASDAQLMLRKRHKELSNLLKCLTS